MNEKRAWDVLKGVLWGTTWTLGRAGGAASAAATTTPGVAPAPAGETGKIESEAAPARAANDEGAAATPATPGVALMNTGTPAWDGNQAKEQLTPGGQTTPTLAPAAGEGKTGAPATNGPSADTVAPGGNLAKGQLTPSWCGNKDEDSE